MSSDKIDMVEVDRMLAAMPLTYRMSRLTMTGGIMTATMAAIIGTTILAMPAITMGLVPPIVPALGLWAIGGIALLQSWLKWRSVELVIDEGRIAYSTGILSRYVHVVSVTQVVSVDMVQPLGARQIGLGSLSISTTGTEVLYCPNMEKCNEIAYLVTHLVDAAKGLGPEGLARHRAALGRSQTP